MTAAYLLLLLLLLLVSFCTLLSGAYDGRQEQSRVHDR